MPHPQTAALCLFAGLSLTLAGCGGKDDAARDVPAAGTEGRAGAVDAPAAPKAAAITLAADGPDACFRAIAKHLGADVKVSEITSFFSAGSEVDPDATQPKSQMTTCSVQYQSPSDPRKLVATSMDMAGGTFPAPSPVEISVTGGDAAKFNLADYLIPLSKVNAAGLAPIMAAQTAPMAAIYGKYAWTGVRLEAPDAFSPVHTLRLDIDGRLASNDIKAGGYASVSTDGTRIIRNLLKP